MRQYRQIKEKHADTVLLFRLGDFYETFGDDAVATAKACGITLTKRNNGSAGEIPLAGFPHHQLDTYLPRLVRAGHRVAVCEQLEDPKQAKGIVKRDVVEVVTPGVVLYDKLLDHTKNTYLVALSASTSTNDVVGVAVADVSTGMLSAGDISRQHVASLLESLQPAEILVNKAERDIWEPVLDKLPFAAARTRIEPWIFASDFAESTLLRQFNTSSLKGFGVDHALLGISAAGAIMHYVSEAQRGALQQFTSVRLLSTDTTMILDASTRRNLEIHASMSGGDPAGALVSMIDYTVTPMGARLLRWWLQSPSTALAPIQRRHRIVRGFLRESTVRDDVRMHLGKVGDIERMLTKVMTNRATSRDLVALRSSLQQIPLVIDTLQQSRHTELTELVHGLDPHLALVARLETSLEDEPPLQIGTGRMFRAGYRTDLDEATYALNHGREWIAEYQERERKATGISTLKVSTTNVFGYFLEVPNTHKAKVPEHYHRKQTLANAERYITEELKAFEERLLNAESIVHALETQLLDELRSTIAEHGVSIQQTAHRLAVIDALVGFAHLSHVHSYVEPEMHEGTELEIIGARHPVIERLLPAGVSYTPNDVRMDTTSSQVHILTGPNMSGKSSYLRQVGLIVFLAHVGCFVPAASARIPRTDRIFTRVGAQDNIMAGESTFLVEMQEAANILHNATDRSLILLDEVGRGTATFDGISIAWAIAEYLHDTVGAKTIFATHYHELTSITETCPRVKNLQVEVREVGDTIVFTHRVTPGHSDHSFGIHVATMAGLPRSVVQRATQLLVSLEGEHVQAPVLQRERQPSSSTGLTTPQYSLFEVQDDALRSRIACLDLDAMTPLQALQTLAELKGQCDG